jgi:hypothetical protein
MVALHENDRVVMDDPSADKQGSASCFRGGKVMRPITPAVTAHRPIRLRTAVFDRQLGLPF